MTIYGYLFAFYDDGPFEAESQQSLRITITVSDNNENQESMGKITQLTAWQALRPTSGRLPSPTSHQFLVGSSLSLLISLKCFYRLNSFQQQQIQFP